MDNKLIEYILRHSRKRDKELKYDFMPSLLEIIECPAHKAGKVIIIGVFTLLIVVIMWACLSKIDVVITAGGSMQPQGDLNVVQSYSSGFVKSINVSEGEYVETGDVLIELDTEIIDIDENQLNSQLIILNAQKELYALINIGEDISAIKLDNYSAELRSYIQTIIDNNTNYRNTLLDLEKEKSSAELNQQIAQLQLETYQENNMDSQAQMQEITIEQYSIAVERADIEIAAAKAQYSAQINTQLSQISDQINEIESSLEKYRLSKEYQVITAPVSGYVNGVAVNTIGETVEVAEQLVVIVPDTIPIEMVCYVKNMDIADVEIGMETEIKLEAYPYNKYGTVKGKVSYISPSAFVSEQLGSVYLVKIQITDKNANIELLSGLSGIVEIKTDKRTVIEYFLDPIIKGFGDSLKER